MEGTLVDWTTCFNGRWWVLALAGALISCASVVLASDNGARDALLKKPIQEQKGILQDVVGDGCRVTRVFFNGIAKRAIAKARAFWSVACADGRTFIVMIPHSAMTAPWGLAASGMSRMLCAHGPIEQVWVRRLRDSPIRARVFQDLLKFLLGLTGTTARFHYDAAFELGV